jgi:hypothetical protein
MDTENRKAATVQLVDIRKLVECRCQAPAGLDAQLVEQSSEMAHETAVLT